LLGVKDDINRRKMKHVAYTIYLCSLITLMSSCIGDDLVFDEVEPMVFITSTIDTLAVGTSFQLEAKFLDNVGREQVLPKVWTSSAPDIISVDQQGLVTGLNVGSALITAELNENGVLYIDDIALVVGDVTTQASISRVGTIKTTSSYRLEGGFTLEEKGDGLVLSIDDSYETTSALPGLYLYLTNNKNSNAGALEIGEVTIFSGAHSYQIPDDVGINDYQYLLYYCKPFSVKVGDGEFDN